MIAGFAGYSLKSGFDAATGKNDYFHADAWDGTLSAGLSFNVGDFVTIDSSHILMPGSDVDILLNRVLPALPVGVGRRAGRDQTLHRRNRPRP